MFDFNHPPKEICRNASVVKFIASYMSHRDQMRNEKEKLRSQLRWNAWGMQEPGRWSAAFLVLREKFDRWHNLEMKMDHTTNSTNMVPKGQYMTGAPMAVCLLLQTCNAVAHFSYYGLPIIAYYYLQYGIRNAFDQAAGSVVSNHVCLSVTWLLCARLPDQIPANNNLKSSIFVLCFLLRWYKST